MTFLRGLVIGRVLSQGLNNADPFATGVVLISQHSSTLGHIYFIFYMAEPASLKAKHLY